MIYVQCYDPKTEEIWEQYMQDENEMKALIKEKDYSIRRIDEVI
jgi:hypothetical protein